MHVVRALVIALLLGHAPHVKLEQPPYAGTLIVRLLACDWWVHCTVGPAGQQLCAVKWVCPWPE